MKLQHVERCNVVYRNGHCQHYLCRQGCHLKTDASVGTVTQTLKTKICVIKDLLYLSAARGRPVGPVAGSLHSPRVREHLAAPSDWTHHISTNTDLFRKKKLFYCTMLWWHNWIICQQMFFWYFLGLNMNEQKTVYIYRISTIYTIYTFLHHMTF